LKSFGIFVIAQTASRETQNPFCAQQIKAPSNYLNVFSAGGVQVLPDNTLIRSTVSTGGPLFLSNGSIDFTNVKPDVVAVGENVFSSVFINGVNFYLSASSPAIAATAVAGAVALLWSASLSSCEMLLQHRNFSKILLIAIIQLIAPPSRVVIQIMFLDMVTPMLVQPLKQV
jgi:Subtilase family